MSIALVGDAEDLAAVYISWLAAKRGLEVISLQESMLGAQWSFGIDEARNEAFLRTGAGWRSFDELSGIFVRFNPHPPLPVGLSLDERACGAFVQERREGLHRLLESLRCPVINRPQAGRSNASKPYQMRTLKDMGFAVPRWITTNKGDSVAKFSATCSNGVIYKAASGLRSHVRAVDEQLFERLRCGTTCTVIQEYIPGRDVRVHTVVDRALAVEVIADGIDYRFEPGSQYRITDIDPVIASRCCKVASSEQLVLAGFDFRVTPDNHWYCLEMNPVPSFLPYEMSSGCPIGDAILDVLSGAYSVSNKP